MNNASAQKVDFGILGGMNISSHLKNFRFSAENIDLDLNPKVTTGFQAGFITRMELTPSLRLQAEPSIISFGANYDESFVFQGFQFQTDSKTELLYLQIPLLLQLTTVPPERTVYGRPFPETTLHLSGGIFGGYMLDAQFSGTNTGQGAGVPFEGDFSNDVTSQYSDFDGGLIVGAGVEHGVSNKIGFETRAYFSVFDSGDAPNLSFKHQNMALTFSVYFLIQ